MKKQKLRPLTSEDKKLAERIKRLRKEKGISQEKLSEMLKANSNYVANIETHRRGLSLSMVYRLARALGVKLKDLFEF